MQISKEKFQNLESNKKFLEKEYSEQSFFIDVHKEQIYFINSDGIKQFIS